MGVVVVSIPDSYLVKEQPRFHAESMTFSLAISLTEIN